MVHPRHRRDQWKASRPALRYGRPVCMAAAARTGRSCSYARSGTRRMASSSTYGLLRTAAEGCGAWIDERPGARSVMAERELGALVDVLLSDGEPDAAWQVALDNREWDPGQHRVDAFRGSACASLPHQAMHSRSTATCAIELEETGRPVCTGALGDLSRLLAV